MKRVAVIGSQGVPANYGGFESLVENLIDGASNRGVHYTVFCGGKDYDKHLGQYKGADLRYIPLHANGAQSVPYDVISLIRCLGRSFDCVLILGVSGCLFLPVFRLFFRGRIVVNIDGLEHRRKKWNRFAQWFLRTSEAAAVKFADVVVSDNKGIQEYVSERYGKKSELIAYGGDHALADVTERRAEEILDCYGLKKGGYMVSVCRIEPENNCHLILEGFKGREETMIFIGNWDRSPYGRNLKSAYAGCANIRFLDPMYDLEKLYVLRSNAAAYIHGHSAGGTNPSLVEAMYFGIPVIAYDVVYNRETTENKSLYFSSSEELSRLLDNKSAYEGTGVELRKVAEREYLWTRITAKYEKTFFED